MLSDPRSGRQQQSAQRPMRAPRQQLLQHYPGGAECVSCAKPLSEKEQFRAHETDGRCTGCQHLFDVRTLKSAGTAHPLQSGQYCRVCEQLWQRNDSNLVACVECGFYIHTHCDKQAAQSIKVGPQAP